MTPSTGNDTRQYSIAEYNIPFGSLGECKKRQNPCKLQDLLVMKQCYFMHGALDARADEHEVRPRGNRRYHL